MEQHSQPAAQLSLELQPLPVAETMARRMELWQRARLLPEAIAPECFVVATPALAEPEPVVAARPIARLSVAERRPFDAARFAERS